MSNPSRFIDGCVWNRSIDERDRHDAAEGLGALDRFYGLGHRLRTLEVSPRYNIEVLYTSMNNLAVRRTEIELTQRQLTTLGKDPEGQEVLFFFDTEVERHLFIFHAE